MSIGHLDNLFSDLKFCPRFYLSAIVVSYWFAWISRYSKYWILDNYMCCKCFPFYSLVASSSVAHLQWSYKSRTILFPACASSADTGMWSLSTLWMRKEEVKPFSMCGQSCLTQVRKAVSTACSFLLKWLPFPALMINHKLKPLKKWGKIGEDVAWWG